jgi:signal transduction histidine kinase
MAAVVQLDARRSAEVARGRAETLARTAGIWLDGDAHSGLGLEPGKRLEDLSANLARLLEDSDGEFVVRTLVPKPEIKTKLLAQPGARHAGALEVVLQSGAEGGRKDWDYEADLEPVLSEGEVMSRALGARVQAFAPVLDSWGGFPALVCVEGPASAPLWRRLAFLAVALLLGGLLTSLLIHLARRSAERLEVQLATLDSGVRQLANGQRSSPFALARSASRELAALAESLEALRVRLEAQASGQALPPPQARAQEERKAVHGEATEFDLALLVQQALEPLQKMAHTRGIELQLLIPEGLPAVLVGHPVPLLRALDLLLRNALRTTSEGRVTLRVSRTPGEQLRFEITDTSQGIPFNQHAELIARLQQAAYADATTLSEPLDIASALVRTLGGELAFQSQPGQGSRFGFSATFHGLPPLQSTGFHPKPATAFQPAFAAPFPTPRTALNPRASISLRS